MINYKKIKNSFAYLFIFSFVILSIGLFAYLFIFTQGANAQTSLPKGISVMPSIAQIDLNTDPAEYELRYVNNTPADISLILSAQDFTELEDGYKISYLEGKDANNYKYSLSSWISFENKNLQLSPGEEKTVKIFIDKERLTRGGHYASILAKVDQVNSKESININPVISSLLFVRASTGNEIENGKINSFKPDRRLFAFPKKIILKFQNNGNVFVVPYGTIQIFDPMGKKVSNNILNESSSNVLPESIRRFDVPIKNDKKVLLPGFYTTKVNLNYGTTKKQLNEEYKFFSLGSLNLTYIIIIFVILFIGILFVRKRRQNNHKTN